MEGLEHLGGGAGCCVGGGEVSEGEAVHFGVRMLFGFWGHLLVVVVVYWSVMRVVVYSTVMMVVIC